MDLMLNGTFLCLKVIYAGFYNKFKTFCRICKERYTLQIYPHEKINRCLTDINRYLTDTKNQFYKVSVISVKYRSSIGLYRSNIGLPRFLP